MLTLPAFSPAQVANATFATTWRGHTHGGVNLVQSIGANQGDEITLIVRCNVQPPCFIGLPTLIRGPQFHEIPNHGGQRQEYRVLVPSRGDWFINAVYHGLGPEQDYRIWVRAAEPLN